MLGLVLTAAAGVLVLLLVLVAAAMVAADPAVPTRYPGPLRRVMAVFPHADDETVTCGGALHRLARQGARVVLVLCTEGERGTPDGSLRPSLRAVRGAEAGAAARRLGLAEVVQWDLGDGGLRDRRAELRALLAGAIDRERPELLITYDRAGLYGHVDHIVCSEVVTALRDERFPALRLWHVALPRRILAVLRWSGQLAGGPELEHGRAAPTHKVFVGASAIAKLRARRAYRSQRRGLARGVARLVPAGLVVVVQLFEYFTEVPGTPWER